MNTTNTFSPQTQLDNADLNTAPSMRAMTASKGGVTQLAKIARPKPRKGEVRVKVMIAAVNPIVSAVREP